MMRIALLTSRVPILSDFTRHPSHITGPSSSSPSSVPFSQIFDLAAYTASGNTTHPRPATTLADLKLEPPQGLPERLGCFAVPSSPDQRPLGVVAASRLEGSNYSPVRAIDVDVWTAGAGPGIDDFVAWTKDWSGRVEPWLDEVEDWLGDNPQPGEKPGSVFVPKRPSAQQLCLTSVRPLPVPCPFLIAMRG